MAVFAAQTLILTAYYLHKKLRNAGCRNLELAMPELSYDRRRRIVKGVFCNLGRMLGEFSQFPKITSKNITDLVIYDGIEHYENAASQGKGILFLTGHFGAWELCAFAHGAYGHPLNFLVRPMDNPLLDELITRYRTLSGNRIIDKNESVRPVLTALKRGEAIGLLIDVNTMADEGVFCDFFGIPACSTPGLAVFALRSNAPVVPGFLLWDKEAKKFILRFDAEVPLIRTDEYKEEILLNTAQFAKVIEKYAREYPEQWLWIHKRWHTRPPGEPGLYNKLIQ